MNKNIGLVLILCSVLAAAGAGEAYAAAGQFQFVAGEVKVINRAGVERVALKGMDVDEGDTVATIAGAAAQIRMVDGGFMAVRPDSRLKVETFVFNGKQDGQERSLILLLKGGFRAITGLIGNLNKQNYLIRTPSATIGIRGTDHEPMFIPQPLPGVAAIGVPGTYDKVNLGAAFIRTDLGIIHINPNQVGFVAGADKVPQLLPKIPEFYKSAPEKLLPVEKSDANELQQKDSKSENLRDERNLKPAPEKLLPVEKSDANELQQKDSKAGSLREERNPKDGRPVLEGRAAPTATSTLTAPATTLKAAPTTSTTLISPITSTKTLIEPTTILIAPTTLQIAPTTTLIAPTTTTTTSTTTLIAPTTSTTTLVSPTTTTTSTTTLIAPTKLIAPTTTLIAPTTTTIKLTP
jgi:hypothetical protein